ncbi:MAG: GNAT family N-acetyltransferase [Bacteroidetes bacterium]|nr:GNAT family N-acetyltransferase [Bacteroidota bacterium]
MNRISLLKADVSDCEKIQKLATAIWHQHYTSIISLNQIEYMLNKMYSVNALTQQMVEQKHLFYFIENNNILYGFISIKLTSGNEYFINKFYIDETISNTGVGSIVLAQIKNIFKPSAMRLTVNRKNFKAINFYFKNNFKIEKVEDFDIGDGYFMEDFIMLWQS